MISVALLLMACHTEVLIAPDPGHAGLQVVAGGDVTDTIEAQPLQALIAEVRGSDGQPAQGLVVRFESLPSADTTRRTDAAVYVCQLTAPTCGQTSTLLTSASLFATDTVDAKGRAKAIVRLGRIPGKAFVRISVPELGLVDTVAYTVLTGAPGGVRGSAADTGLTIGATAVLRGRVVDRYNNPRAELPAMSAGPGVAFTLDPASGTITGTAMGTQYAFFRFGAYVDSTIVRVVPPGRLVVWVPGRGAVRLVDLNGTGVVQTVIASSVTSDLGVYPRFDGTRQRVTLHVGPGPSSTVTVVDTLGTNRRDIGAVFTTIVNERQLSDGTLLVVGRLTTEAAATPFSLWRVGPDNAVTRVAALPGLGTTYNGADISHDGTRVAYVGSPSSLTELRVLNVVSGQLTVLDANGKSPRWSAQGDRIAYLLPTTTSSGLDGTPAVINADGSGRRTLGISVFSPGLAWSPDGVYLTGRGNTGAALRLIRVSDGAEMQLRIRNAAGTIEDVYQPDWR